MKARAWLPGFFCWLLSCAGSAAAHEHHHPHHHWESVQLRGELWVQIWGLAAVLVGLAVWRMLERKRLQGES